MDRYETHGAFSWNELMTTDPAAAVEFYSALFGWSAHDMPSPEGNYNIMKIGEESVGGIMSIPAMAKGAPPSWGSYMTVDDIDVTVSKATELGATVLLEPQDVPTVGRLSVIRDPQGAVFHIISYAADE